MFQRTFYLFILSLRIFIFSYFMIQHWIRDDKVSRQRSSVLSTKSSFFFIRKIIFKSNAVLLETNEGERNLLFFIKVSWIKKDFNKNIGESLLLTFSSQILFDKLWFLFRKTLISCDISAVTSSGAHTGDYIHITHHRFIICLFYLWSFFSKQRW